MQVIRYKNPVENDPFTRMFNELMNHQNEVSNKDWYLSPRVNIIRGADSFTIQFAAPGYQKEQFKISHEDDVLVVRATVDKKDERQEEKNESFELREFAPVTFEKKFQLGENVAVEQISASYKDGILSVVLPKKPMEEKKRIEVSVN